MVKFELNKTNSLPCAKLSDKNTLNKMIFINHKSLSLSLSMRHFITLKRGSTVEHVFNIAGIVMLQS